MKKHKNKIIAGVIIVAALTAAFLMGGIDSGRRSGDTVQEPGAAFPPAGSGSPGHMDSADPGNGSQPGGVGQQGGGGNPQSSTDPGTSGEPGFPEDNSSPSHPPSGESSQQPPGGAAPPASGGNTPGSTGTQPPGGSGTHPGGSGTQPGGSETQPPGQPSPDPPSSGSQQGGGTQQGGGSQQPGDTERDMTITLIISVATILDNMDKLTDGKAGLIPPDGIIFNDTVVFYEDESVFNVLLREVRKNRIHMEFVNTPIYNSAYIEGIHNIYEFDAGERSGWIYSVNGGFPNYGSSRYTLQDGDVVMWLFTCDRGADIGGEDAAGSYNWGG